MCLALFIKLILSIGLSVDVVCVSVGSMPRMVYLYVSELVGIH